MDSKPPNVISESGSPFSNERFGGFALIFVTLATLRWRALRAAVVIVMLLTHLRCAQPEFLR